MTGKNIGYKRVSSGDQNPERQLQAIPLDKVFIEYASGTTIKRPQLEIMIDYAREDDVIIVHSMDRLARNVKDLRQIIDTLIAKGVVIRFLKEGLTFTGKDSPMANLLLMLMGSIAEFEHSLIRERQLEGIAIAKKKGRYRGGVRKMNAEKIQIMKDCLQTRKSKSKIALELGISRYTLYRYIKEEQQQQED